MSARDIDLKFPVLHAKQEIVRASKIRYRVLACGRRWGKTTLITDEAVEELAYSRRVGYFNLSYKQGLEVWEDFKRLTAPILRHKDEKDRRLETLTGGILEMWSFDNEQTVRNSRGRKYDLVIIDEAAHIPILLNVWDKVIRPMLMDTGGRALFASSPNGFNDFYTLYQRGQDPLKKNWKSFNYPTSTNPMISPAEIEEARSETTEQAFEQEYLAKFLPDGAGVFRGVSAVATMPLSNAPVAGMRYVIGVDWGKKADFTVIVVMCVDNMQMVALDRFNQIDYHFQRERLKVIVDLWRPVDILIEENSIGDVNIEELRRDGIAVTPFMTTAVNKPPLIEELAIAIEKGRIAIMPHPVLLNEMNAFTLTRTATGRPQYGAPKGGHDDTVMALALAYESALGHQAHGDVDWHDWRGG